MSTSGPKILTVDIESSPLASHTWGIFEQDIALNQIVSEWSILSFTAKWLGDKEIIQAHTGGRGIKKVRDDKALCVKLWALLDEADIVIAQNGKKFDIRKINARLMMHGFMPYSPIRVIDTLSVAKKHFGFTSNKLEWLSKHLTTTKKSTHKNFPGFEMWTECLRDNPKAWTEMMLYNKIDVIATEELYLALRPWITGHPSLALYVDESKSMACPKCSSPKLVHRGTSVTQGGKFQRFQCNACGGWSRGRQNLVPLDSRKQLKVN